MALPPQSATETSFVRAIVELPIQTVSSPFRAVYLISTCSGRKLCREDERLSSPKRVRSVEELLHMRLEIPPIRGLAVTPFQGAARVDVRLTQLRP